MRTDWYEGRRFAFHRYDGEARWQGYALYEIRNGERVRAGETMDATKARAWLQLEGIDHGA